MVRYWLGIAPHRVLIFTSREGAAHPTEDSWSPPRPKIMQARLLPVRSHCSGMQRLRLRWAALLRPQLQKRDVTGRHARRVQCRLPLHSIGATTFVQ